MPAVCVHCLAQSESLQRCGRCKSVSYCNKDCQKAHWSKHKGECRRVAQGASPQFRDAEQDRKPFTAIHHGKFLHNRSEKTTFNLLIDLMRMRQEDEYTIDANNMTGTIYSGEPTSEPAFRTFISKAEAVPGFLPPWWSKDKLEECIRYSLNSQDFSLAHAEEKSDIQKTWNDNTMPMKLRMLAEKVYGNTPGGFRGDSMMELMMQQESGRGPAVMSHFQMA